MSLISPKAWIKDFEWSNLLFKCVYYFFFLRFLSLHFKYFFNYSHVCPKALKELYYRLKRILSRHNCLRPPLFLQLFLHKFSILSCINKNSNSAGIFRNQISCRRHKKLSILNPRWQYLLKVYVKQLAFFSAHQHLSLEETMLSSSR